MNSVQRLTRPQIKQNILESGWQTLNREGQSALKIRNLAIASHCSIGTIYNIFSNLDEILLHLNLKSFLLMLSVLQKNLDEELEKKRSLNQVVRKLSETYIEFAKNYPNQWKALFENISLEKPPKWYVEKIQNGIDQFEKKLEISFQLSSKTVKTIVSFFWITIHGMASLLVNKKTRIVSRLINEEDFGDHIDHYLKEITS